MRNFLLIVALVVGMGLGVAAYPYIQGAISGVMSVYNAETAKKDVEEKKEIKDDKKTDNDRVAKVENKKTEDDGKIADKEQPKSADAKTAVDNSSKGPDAGSVAKTNPNSSGGTDNSAAQPNANGTDNSSAQTNNTDNAGAKSNGTDNSANANGSSSTDNSATNANSGNSGNSSGTDNSGANAGSSGGGGNGSGSGGSGGGTGGGSDGSGSGPGGSDGSSGSSSPSGPPPGATTPTTNPDLAAQNLSGSLNGSAFILKGTIANLDPTNPAAGKRQYQFLRWSGSTWVALQPAAAVPLNLAPNQTAPVQMSLTTPPPAATKFRLQLTPPDANPSNDSTDWTVPAVKLPPGGATLNSADLTALPLTKTKQGNQWTVHGTVKNLGSAAYTSGRTYRIEQWTGSQWILVKTGAVTPLTVNQTLAVQVAVGSPRAGTNYRMRIVPADSNPANDNSPLLVVP